MILSYHFKTVQAKQIENIFVEKVHVDNSGEACNIGSSNDHQSVKDEWN